ncbi:hypothetical protein Aperf_G00000096459 [Anoplocephala perfoliata]
MTKLIEEALKIFNIVSAHLVDLEDFGDRFNYIGCTLVLLVCTLVVSTRQYFFSPISCFIATEVGGTNLLHYVENYCWVQGTVPITYTGQMPSNEEEWNELEGKKILYYQWVPFVLGLQCVLFCIPRLIWKTLYLHASTHGNILSRVVLRSVDALRTPAKKRQAIIDEIADTAEYFFNKHSFKNISSGMCRVRCFHKTNIITSYTIVKILYLINAVGQLIMMQRYLGFQSFGYGMHVFRDILNGHDWQVTQIFPRVGFCYIELKFLGVPKNAVTAQCVLPQNMLNEKIYIFLWWWITAAAIITITSLIRWTFRFSTRKKETDYILKYMILGSNGFRAYDQRDIMNFATKYLRREGIFLVRMIRLNAGEQVAAAVVRAFWQRYRLAVMDPLRMASPSSNIPTSPRSKITPRDLDSQFKNFSKGSSSSGGDAMAGDTAHDKVFV